MYGRRAAHDLAAVEKLAEPREAPRSHDLSADLDELFARRDPETGHLIKREFGPWVFRAMKLLARLRGLRGTAFDVFGYSAERKRERRLIADYETIMDEVLAGLDPESHALAVELAAVPEGIRGFGHVKERHLEVAEAHQTQLLQAFRNPQTRKTAAE